MIYPLGDNIAPEKCGGKAALLSLLKQSGFNVPSGFVISSEELSAYRASCADEAQALSENAAPFPADRLPELAQSKLYAVRSSGSLEDSAGMSFAGQYRTLLNTAPRDVPDAVRQCCLSMYSPEALSYLAANGISPDSMRMSVIIQEMVDSEKSGVVFTLNPVTGCDTEIVAEISPGLGEELVSGKTAPERHVLGWYDEPQAGGTLLSPSELSELRDTSLKIMRLLGYPCDIEFAYSKGRCHILQARPVTKIMYTGIKDQWTTADFKDGGVSAETCKPYMWSLYEMIWESELKGFMLEARILKPAALRKLGEMFYGRPYWNLSVVKTAMATVPGYKERDFDNEFGITPAYSGDGVTTSVNPKTLAGILRMAVAQKKIVRTRRKNAESLKELLLSRYNEYLEKKDCISSQSEAERFWVRLITDDYLFSESTYFRQIFINTIHQSLYRGKLLRYTDEAGYFMLIGGLDNISHLLPFYRMWDISREIRDNPEALAYWSENTADKICADYLAQQRGNHLSEVAEFITLYGYHSKKELDVSYPCFDEDPAEVIGQLRETVLIGDEFSPEADKCSMAKLYEQAMEKLPQNARKTVAQMRSMLWWREEFRDISTRFYHLIRLYTMKLAEFWANAKVIAQPDDIWYLKLEDIQSYISRSTDIPTLRAIAERRRAYYECYRNFTSENEIGRAFFAPSGKKSGKGGLHGLGCSCGEAEGIARVITDIADIGRIRCDDILVTKFTDTGWTSKFAMLRGIVTEYGGMLCHAAIVSREYGIVCVVCAENATKLISDGDRIRINGETGEITVIK